MSEPTFWQSPLEGLLPPGSHTGGLPDVTVQERRNVAQYQIIARKDTATQLARAVARMLGRKTPLSPLEGGSNNGIFIGATGPFEYWAAAESKTAQKALGKPGGAIHKAASVFDQSAGRAVIRISGKCAADLLAKGTALDLHAADLPAESASLTAIAHMPAVLIRRHKPECYDISLSVSYAASFASWLLEAIEEFDHRIAAARE
ncbi:MAG: hypothetical protein MI861_01655 [Pirellulales bacterium]|nr:hypothetical protein [Pirellulales bacterium]